MNGQCEQPSIHRQHPSRRRRPQHGQKKRPSKRHPESVWDKYKREIEHLYLTEGLTCKEVAKRIEEKHKFSATYVNLNLLSNLKLTLARPRQYKPHLERWGFAKNVTHRDWLQAVLLKHEYSETGIRVRGFNIHGSFKNIRKLDRYIEQKGMSEEQFLMEARKENVKVSGICCVLPPSEPESAHTATEGISRPTGSPSTYATKDSGYGTIQRDSTSAFSISTGSNSLSQITTPSTHNSKSFSSGGSYVQDSSPTRVRSDRSTHESFRGPVQDDYHGLMHAEHILSSTTDEVPMVISPEMDLSAHLAKKHSGSNTHLYACDSVQQDFGAMGVQVYRPGASRDFGMTNDIASWSMISSPQLATENRQCRKCQYPLRDHSPLPQDWLYGDPSDLPQRLSQQPLGAGVYTSLTEDEASTFIICCFSACKFQTEKKYEMFSDSLQRTKETFRKMLLDENRLALLSVLSALTILHVHDQGELSAAIIRSVLSVCHDVRGGADAWTICIRWLAHAAGRKLKDCPVNVDDLCVVLTRMRRQYGTQHENTIVAGYCYAFQLAFDKRYAEAEVQYKDLIEICEETLAPDHIQTISCRNGLSRVQSQQGGDQTEAIENLKKSLMAQPLGPNHPFRLETRKRLALLYKKSGQMDLAEHEYWAVLKGRLRVLGKSHQFTEDARLQLQRFLQRVNKWTPEVEEQIRIMVQEGSDTTGTDIELFDCPNSSWKRPSRSV